jgi:hypothetical protein
MNQTDAERLDELAEEYSTNADYCRHMAKIVGNSSSKAHWVRLAESWTTLAKETKARSRWTELALH